MLILYRVDRILKDHYYLKCIENNAEREKNRRFCRHDMQHMLDVARIAYMLLLEEGSQDEIAPPYNQGAAFNIKEIVYAAGLLHDMARWVEYDTGQDHAAAGAELAVPVLNRAGFGPTEREIITVAINEHRTGGEKASLLGQYLGRADDLARPCSRCAARRECYKIERMETARMLLY